MVNSAGDWGHSDPLAVPEFIFEMRRRGHDEALIRKVVYENPLTFFSQCARFEFRRPRDDRNGQRRRKRVRQSAGRDEASAAAVPERTKRVRCPVSACKR